MISSNKDAVANDVNKTVSDVKRGGRDAWDKVIDAKDDLQNAANKAGRNVRGYIDTASEELTHASDSVKTHIRSNPVQSSLVALAAGFIIGRLFRL